MDNCFTIEDRLVVNDPKEFRNYLRANKLTKEKFIIDRFHKFDLLSGEPLIYKNENQYFNNDFNSRENLIEYFLLCENPLEFCLDFFNRRKAYKNLIYAPSHLELKTFIAPSVAAIQKRGINYNELMNQVELKCKYNYSINKLNINNNQELIIIQDTREQNPLKFKVKTEINKLDIGDYTCLPPCFSNIYIERKSLNDFIGTLSIKGFDRFKREIGRAVNLNSFILVVIENPLRTALKFNELSYNFAKVTPDYIFRNVRELMQEFNNLQFLFVNGRNEAARTIEKIFKAESEIKTIDLQWSYEKGIL